MGKKGKHSIFITTELIVLLFVVFLSFGGLYYQVNKLTAKVKEGQVYGSMSKMTSKFTADIHDISSSLISLVSENSPYIKDKDSCFVILRRALNTNPSVLSVSMQYRKNFFEGHRLYCPFVMRPFGKYDYTETDAYNPQNLPEEQKKIFLNSEYRDYLKNDVVFKKACKVKVAFFSEPYLGFGNSLVLDFVYPWVNMEDGSVTTVFNTTIMLKNWFEIMKKADPYPNGKISIISKYNKVICSMNDSIIGMNNAIEYFSEVYDFDLRQVVKEALEGKEFYRILDNRTFLYVGLLQNADWAFIYTCPLSDLWRDTRKSFYTCVAIVLVSVLLIFICGLWNMKRINKFIHNDAMRNSDIRHAMNIQKSMLPTSLEGNPHISCHAVLRPSQMVGGDLYYHFIKNGHFYFCIGDVSGKGIPASLFMAKTVTLYKYTANLSISPADIAETLNYDLCQNNQENMFVTAFFGILNIRTGELKYCNAGHEYPIIFTCKNGVCKTSILDESQNMPIGIDSEQRFEDSIIYLEPNTILMAYTDGVTEAKNDSLAMYGMSRLVTFINSHRDLDSKRLNDALMEDISQFVGNYEQSDDITMITFKYTDYQKSLRINNDVKELRKLNELIDEIKTNIGLTRNETTKIKVGLDEALTNVVMYAYKEKNQSVDVLAMKQNDILVFEIHDSGTPFNPLEYKTNTPSIIEIENPCEDDLKVGGFGIPLIKTIFDYVEYKFENNENILILKKDLKKWNL